MQRDVRTIRRDRNIRRVGLRGFTLVELVASMTIGSLVVVSAVGATRALTASRESAEIRMARSAAARRAMEAIVGALRNVRRDPVYGKSVVAGRSAGDGGMSDVIDLLVIDDRRVRPDGAESDQYEMSFSLARLAGRRLPALMCRRDHALDDHPADGGIASVVAEGIVGLTFEYYADEQWLSEWLSAEPRAPEAVRVTVAAVGPIPTESRTMPTPLVLSTIVPIHVNSPTEPKQESEQQKQPQGGPSSGGPKT